MLAVRWLHGDSASSPAMLYVVRCMSCTAWCISCTATRGRRPSWSRRRRLRKSRESGGSAQTHSVRRVCAQLCPTMRARPSVRPVRRCEYSSTPYPLLRPAALPSAPSADVSTLVPHPHCYGQPALPSAQTSVRLSLRLPRCAVYLYTTLSVSLRASPLNAVGDCQHNAIQPCCIARPLRRIVHCSCR